MLQIYTTDCYQYFYFMLQMYQINVPDLNKGSPKNNYIQTLHKKMDKIINDRKCFFFSHFGMWEKCTTWYEYDHLVPYGDIKVWIFHKRKGLYGKSGQKCWRFWKNGFSIYFLQNCTRNPIFQPDRYRPNQYLKSVGSRFLKFSFFLAHLGQFSRKKCTLWCQISVPHLLIFKNILTRTSLLGPTAPSLILILRNWIWISEVNKNIFSKFFHFTRFGVHFHVFCQSFPNSHLFIKVPP